MRFRAVSMQSRQYREIQEYGRLRGCMKGEFVYVYGQTIQDAYFHLDIIRQTFRDNTTIILSENRRDRFRIEELA